MNFRIVNISGRSRREMTKTFFRWLIYAALLLAFFVIQSTFPFFKFRPLLTAALAVAVAMYEGELSGVVFAVFAGLTVDMAMARAVLPYGYATFGKSYTSQSGKLSLDKYFGANYTRIYGIAF